MKQSVRPWLKIGSMASYVQLGLDTSSTLKAQARLRLENFGLIPPLYRTLGESKLIGPTLHYEKPG